MVTAEKKPKPVAAPVAAPVVSTPVVAPPIVSTPVVAPTTPAVVPTTPIVQAPAVINQQALESLVSMGYPDQDVRAALAAARGNADLAYEFLNTGIPQMQQQQHNHQVAPSSGSGLEQLRQHPQFNQLKQLVQTNPAALPQVLNLLGQQSPALLTAINANEEAFITMMNEPITDTPPPVPQAQQPMLGGPGGINPQQMMSMLSSMPVEQRSQMAQSMGLTPEQLQNVMQMVSMMPPDQLQQMMTQGGMGAGLQQGGVPPGATVIRLSEEELASVDRLVALGFTQQQAAEAFMVCDRNEEIAANYLYDNQDDGYDAVYDAGEYGGDGGDGEHGDEDDDMYN